MARPATRPRGPTGLDAGLALAAGGEPAAERDRLAALRRFVLAYGAVRSILWLGFLDAPEATVAPAVVAPTAAWLAACAALAFRPRFARQAPLLALPALAVQGVATFPFFDNHFFLETLCVALLACAGDAEDDVRVVRALRVLGAGVLFHAGWQKVSYGLYWQGDFASFMAATDDRFAAVLGPVLGEETLAALRALDPFASGAGPFRADSRALVLGSNAVVLAELALPALLLVPRTRALALPAAIALVLAIQLPARELGFALLFSNVLLLFAASNANARLAPWNYAVFALALLAWPWLAPGIL